MCLIICKQPPTFDYMPGFRQAVTELYPSPPKEADRVTQYRVSQELRFDARNKIII